MCIRDSPQPLTDPRPFCPISAEITVFCDASGDTSREAYLGLLVNESPINPMDLALSYRLPRSFLEAWDEKGPNKNNTMLLELLCPITLLVEWGPLLRGRTVIFITDSLNLAILVEKGRVPKGANTCFALQALYELAQQMSIRMSIQWRRRKSCTWTTAADDLSHADFHKLPFHLMNNTKYQIMELPKPIQRTLDEATEDKTTGFPDLRRLIQQDWKRKGWCKEMWLHDKFFE